MAGRQPVAGGGMWSPPKSQFSKETQDLLKVMMEESKLTNFQRRHLQQNVKKGQGLPIHCKPTTSEIKASSSVTKKQTPKSTTRSSAGSRRSKDTIEALTNNYECEKFQPLPGRRITEEDKHRFQNKMAFGVDTPAKQMSTKDIAAMRAKQKEMMAQDIDRFDEVVKEIEERREFLDEMEALGQGKKYRSIIATEISQKIKELEQIDKARSKDLLELTKESTD